MAHNTEDALKACTKNPVELPPKQNKHNFQQQAISRPQPPRYNKSTGSCKQAYLLVAGRIRTRGMDLYQV